MRATEQRAIRIDRFSKRNDNLQEVKIPIPLPNSGEILIEIEAFGLNFADIMARKGKYRDAPPLPFVPGYDVVGRVVEAGEHTDNSLIGKRVCALTRFGGYAQFAIAKPEALMIIPEDMPVCTALSLATQGATAWHCIESADLLEGEKVLITAAAGGVGSLLTQLALYKKCEVYAIVGSKEKEQLMLEMGVKAAINRKEEDVFEAFKSLSKQEKIDVFFDSAGGSFTRKGIKNLAMGGRYIGYGGSQGSQAHSFWANLKFILSFGIYHPGPFFMSSQSLIGVNMLKLADYKPERIKKSMESIFQLHAQNIIQPLRGAEFPVSQIQEAHRLMEHGAIAGKIAILW